MSESLHRRVAASCVIIGAMGAQLAAALVFAAPAPSSSLLAQGRMGLIVAILIASASLFWCGIGIRYHQVWARFAIGGLLLGTQAALAGSALVIAATAVFLRCLEQPGLLLLPALLLSAGEAMGAVLLRPAIRYFVAGQQRQGLSAAV